MSNITQEEADRQNAALAAPRAAIAKAQPPATPEQQAPQGWKLVRVELLEKLRDFIDTTTAPAYPAGADLADEIDAVLAASPAGPVSGFKVDMSLVGKWQRENNVVQAVIDEVQRATKKFPTWPTDPLHALAVLGEEFGELTKDALQLTYEPHKTNAANVRKEAMQTAAMALRWAMSLERYEYTPCAQHSQQDAHGIPATTPTQAAQGGEA